MRYFLHLSYNGARYHGWQIQPNGDSVEAKLEWALGILLHKPTNVVGAGRTDAGVNARVMVAHFDSDEELDIKQTVFRLNRMLPRDISIASLEHVSDDMHARFSARKRTYRYFIHTWKNPFVCDLSYEVYYPLDFDIMAEGCNILKTTKDFAAFCKAGADVKTTLCDLYEAKWVKSDEHEYYFEISANRFLRNMVRAVVGTLIDLGRHRITIEQFQDIIVSGNRSNAGESVPGKALFLWDIEY